MRVTHVYKDVYPPVAGGIERHIDTLRRSCPVDATVLVCRRGRRTEIVDTESGREVHVGELGRVLSAPLAPTFPFWLRRTGGDVVHLHMPNPTGELAALGRSGGVPMVANYHADIVRQARLLPIYGRLLDRCFASAQAIVVGTERLRDRSALLRAHRERVEVVPYALDLDRFERSDALAQAGAELRQRLGGQPLIVSVGRLVYYKGFDVLIRALRGIDASLVIVGDGPLEGALRTLAQETGVRVTFAGSVSDADLLTYLAAADCFVLASTSRAESFGIATLEAQALGVPAIVTDVGTGTVEAIAPGETGLVVPPGDERALRDAIESLMREHGLRERMGTAAVDRVRTRHGAEAQAEAYMRIYRRVLDEPSVPRAA